MKVLITGATGLIGKELGKALVKRGHDIYVISRDAEKAKSQLSFPATIIEGHLAQAPLQNPNLQSVDIVINLAGEPIAGLRWNEVRKRRIYESRVLTTRNLIQSLSVAPKVFINASAVGYYGSQGDEVLTEEGPCGDGFLAQLCQDWEEELLTFAYSDFLNTTRVATLRMGLVLAPQGGVLEKLLPLFRRRLGSILGDGKQWMSWIHIEDVVGLFLSVLDKNMLYGPINAVSPNPVTNKEFSETLASVLGTGLAPRVPAAALWASLGEMATLVLYSQRVVPRVALDNGYKFKHPDLREALESVCNTEKEEIYVGEQFLPWKPEQVFSYFTRVENLKKIVPKNFDFEIVTEKNTPIHLGTELRFHLRVHGIPLKWKSLIEEWDPPNKFTDVQLEGPYRFWRHTHEFQPFANGTLVVDRVRYMLPLGYLGNLMGSHFVRSEMEKLFHYRRASLAKNLENDLA